MSTADAISEALKHIEGTRVVYLGEALWRAILMEEDKDPDEDCLWHVEVDGVPVVLDAEMHPKDFEFVRLPTCWPEEA